ncbi:hypothetical protein, partial [Anaerovibrio sp. JC8]|uniref:hypothetical protein n=1 Tax=Anaerovibrio sp. JC8 TaxID=1240085 RepID=UPI0011784E41
METRKYNSSPEGDIGTSKATKGRGWKSLKGQAALALAVSLWIGCGGIASAAGSACINADTNKVVVNNIASDATVTPGNDETASDKTLTVTGNWADVHGAFASASSTIEGIKGYQLNVDNAKTGSVYGAHSIQSSNNVAKDNFLKISNSKVSYAYGGFSNNGSAINNTVELIKSTVINRLYGGKAIRDATGNSIYMTDSTVEEDVYGGINGNDQTTGNTLCLSGDNTVEGRVQNFEIVYIGKQLGENRKPVNVAVKWGTPVLRLTGTSWMNHGYGILANEGGSKATINASELTFANPETVVNGATMNLIECSNTATITADLAATTTALQKYSLKPVTGVSIDATLKGSLAFKTNANDKNIALVCTASNVGNKLTLGANIPWNTTAPYYDLSGKGYGFVLDGNFAIDASKLTFTGLDQAKAGDAMTLLANAAGITGDHITQPSDISYEYSPLSGVMINGAVTGQIAVDSSNVNYQVTGNNASKLTFTDVEWKDSGALLNHKTTLSNVSFDGAAVDTSNIKFTNIEELAANKKMTLVSDFGNSVGTITGTKYKVSTALEGEGEASLDGTNLIFTAKTGTDVKSADWTHNSVMGATASVAALSAGNDFVGAAVDGLSMGSNTGTDGLATFAQMGGGTMRQETGSHVDSHTWNAILALGHQNEKKSGTTEYGAFFEYGTGNYSTFNGDT